MASLNCQYHCISYDSCGDYQDGTPHQLTYLLAYNYKNHQRQQSPDNFMSLLKVPVWGFQPSTTKCSGLVDLVVG